LIRKSLELRGFFPMPSFTGAGLVACDANSSAAATLGERLCFSSPVMSECGACKLKEILGLKP